MNDSTLAGGARATPWYREPWPWILMAGPFTVVVAGFVTLWLAIRSDDGLVEDDYYKQGLAIHQQIGRDDEALRMGLAARAAVDGARDQVEVGLDAAPGVELPGELRLRVAHPTRAGHDRVVLLRAIGAGTYRGKLELPAAGRWLLTLDDAGRAWRLSGEWQVPEGEPVFASPNRREPN